MRRFFFFFQAEDGIRDVAVTGVQTCALPIFRFVRDTLQPMSTEDLKTISDEADFDGPLVDYKAKGNQIELAGKEDFDGKPAYRLKLTSQNGEVRFYLFDASSFLLLKWEGTRKIEGKDYPWESFFTDFREIQGLKYAFKIDQDSPGTRSEEHTSELQSRLHLVCRLLLEKKKYQA